MEIKAACILIILAMHEGQLACFMLEKEPPLPIGKGEGGLQSVCTLEKREKLCLCWELKNKFPYCV